MAVHYARFRFFAGPQGETKRPTGPAQARPLIDPNPGHTKHTSVGKRIHAMGVWADVIGRGLDTLGRNFYYE